MKYQYYLIVIFLVTLIASYYLGYTPILVSMLFLVASGVAYLAYAKDKASAKSGDWRVSENTLHIISVFCGWPGAIIAQEKLRHKTKKTSFRIAFWITVAINLFGFFWVHTDEGRNELRNAVFQIENFTISNVHSRSIVSTVLWFTEFRGDESHQFR
ncbi:MAG: DUF1294 domain-containing protein [Spongiibacter sp.]|nr:DUF1294 domain-containing protein [Spongiibacter sp.]